MLCEMQTASSIIRTPVSISNEDNHFPIILKNKCIIMLRC